MGMSSVPPLSNAAPATAPQRMHLCVQLLGDLRKLLEGIRLTEEASPRVMARVSTFGELASTHLGET